MSRSSCTPFENSAGSDCHTRGSILRLESKMTKSFKLRFSSPIEDFVGPGIAVFGVGYIWIEILIPSDDFIKSFIG